MLVVDSAYPSQVAAGVEMIVTGQDHLDVLRQVKQGLSAAPHVRPVAVLANEFRWLTDDICPNAEVLVATILETLKGVKTEWETHTEILDTVSTAGERYSLLVFKTKSQTAYTSVFFRLECGYWSQSREAALQERLMEDPKV